MRLLARAIELVVIATMGIVVGVVFTEVVMRAFFSGSLIVTDELGRSLMIWTAMLAAALLVREDGHIRITLVSDAVGPRAGLALYLVTQAITIGFLVLVIVTTLQVMPSLAKQRTVTLGISIAWVYAALPVASALMIVFALDGIRRRLLGRDAETHHADATLG